MYRYDEFDRAFVADRVSQFRDQVERRLNGEISEDAFKPLRLMNGVYLQLHAYMLRVAIPYGTLASRQTAQAGRCCAHIRPRLRALHDAPEHPVQLADAFPTFPTSWRNWPASRCTRSRRQATASAT